MSTGTKSLVGFGLLGGFLVVVQVWLWPAVEAAGQEYRDAHKDQELAQQLAGHVAQFEEAVRQQQAVLEQVSDVVPTVATLPFVVTKIEQLAREQGVTLSFNDISEESGDAAEERNVPGTARAVTVRMYLTGGAAELLTWLDEAEHTVELTAVPFWTLNVINNRVQPDGTLLYEMQAELELYVRGDQRLNNVRGLITESDTQGVPGGDPVR